MKLIQKLLVPMLIAAGILANFSREVLLAYACGTSAAVDIFRIATYLPTVFFQTMGAVLVGLYLPHYKPNSDRLYTPTDSRNVTVISFAVAGIGILTSPLLALFAAPGLPADLKVSILWSSIWSWLGFLLVSLTFHYRIQLQSAGKTGIAASTSLIFSTAFVVAMIVLLWSNLFSSSSPNLLIGAFFFACVVLLVIYSDFRRAGSSIFFLIKTQFSCLPCDIVSNRLIVGVFFVQFLLSVPRLLDRGIASESGVGGIAALDYAYNVYTAAGMIIGTSAMIVLAQNLAGVFSEREPVAKFIRLAWRPVALSIVLAVVTAFFSEELVSKIYLRGEFTTDNATQTNGYLLMLMASFAPMVANMLLFQVLLGYGKLRFIVWPTLLKIFFKTFALIALINETPEVAIGISATVGELVFLVAGICYLRLYTTRSSASTE